MDDQSREFSRLGGRDNELQFLEIEVQEEIKL